MIKKFKHKGLKAFFNTGCGSTRGIKVSHQNKLRRILGALNVASVPDDMGLPGFGLHPLTGDLSGLWAVQVSGNWRVIFRLENGDAYDVDYDDYH